MINWKAGGLWYVNVAAQRRSYWSAQLSTGLWLAHESVVHTLIQYLVPLATLLSQLSHVCVVSRSHDCKDKSVPGLLMNLGLTCALLLAAGSLVAAGEPKKITKLQIGVKKRVENCEVKSRKGDKLSMHYRGSLHSDGSEFDSSYERGEPLSFTLGSGQVSSVHIPQPQPHAKLKS